MAPRSGHPLSPNQRDVWFDQLRYPDSTLYNQGGLIHIEGPLKPSVLRRSLKRQLRDHDCFQLGFRTTRSGQPRQAPMEPEKISLPVVDLADEGHFQEALHQRAQPLFDQPFDLAKPPLCRFMLFRESAQSHHLLVVFHHLIMDGYGIFLFVQRLFDTYRIMQRHQKLDLPKPPPFLGRKDGPRPDRAEKSEQFWHDRLKELPPPLQPHRRNMPAPAATQADLNAGIQEQTLPRFLLLRLEHVARIHRLGIFPMFLTAYSACLHHCFGGNRTPIGVSLLNRSGKNAKQTLGHFVDTSLVLPHLDVNQPFSACCAAIMRELRSVYRHHALPFAALAQMGAAMDRDRLFDASFSYETPGFPHSYGKLRLDYKALLTRQLQHPIHLSVRNYREDRDLPVYLEYQTHFMDAFAAREFASLFCKVLTQASEHPERTPARMLAEIRREDPRPAHWSGLDAPTLPPITTIPRLFQHRATEHPDHLALIAGEQSLTYGALFDRASRLAALIATHFGVRRGEVVPILTDHPETMLTAMFAVLQAGAAFLPLNPNDPPGRRRRVLQQCGAHLILCDGENQTRIAMESDLEPVRADRLPEQVPRAPIRAVSPDDAAYVIFTSGTTGRPKGVIVPHGAVVNLATQFLKADLADWPNPQNMAVMDAFFFDAAFHSLFGALLHGHTLHVIPREMAAHPDQVAGFLEKHQIDGINLAPRLLRALYAHADMTGKTLPRSFIDTGTEPLEHEDVTLVFDEPARAALRLTNYYGPTEACVEVTRFPMIAETLARLDEVPIGRPNGGIQVLILDEHMDWAPPGFAGEIYIGGPCLARGYLGSSALTAARFVPHPFRQGQRLYRTGDRGRWLEDGNLAFMGRIDLQLKLRGYRIEPAEIEYHLKRQPEVKRAVVGLHTQDREEPVLVAWLEAQGELDTHALRARLTRVLPHYMMPSHLVTLEALPETPGGAVDRAALPDPVEAGKDQREKRKGRTPRNDLERLLVRIWSHALDQPEIGIHDNFFALGGQSLTAARVLADLREEGLNPHFRDMFDYPTVASLAGYLRDHVGTPAPRMESAPVTESYPLSHGQERLWLLHQTEPHPAAYNMAGAILLEGPLDVAALGESISLLFQRHQVLRTAILAGGTEPRQVLLPVPENPLRLRDLRERSNPMDSARRAALREAMITFDLELSVPFHALLLQLSEETNVLVLNLHHIAGDGESLKVLMRDLAAGYTTQTENDNFALADPGVQYRDFAVWQRGGAKSAAWDAAAAFWSKHLGDPPEPLLLPLDRPRPPVRTAAGARLRRSLGNAAAVAIDSLARSGATTHFSVLVALTQAFLYRLCGQDDLCLGTLVSGRNHPDVGETVGFFVNTVVLRDHVCGTAPLSVRIARATATVTNAFEHGDYPFDLVVGGVSAPRDPSHHPLFDVLITLDTEDPPVPELPGILATPLELSPPLSKFDLSFEFHLNESGLALELAYNADLFDVPTIELLVARFDLMAQRWIERPETPLCRLDLLTEEEHRALHIPPLEPPMAGRDLISQFRERVRAEPELPALVFRERVTTQAELEKTASRICAALQQEHEVNPGDVVVLAAERDPRMIAAMLGVLQCGAAYCWLDRDQPAKRRAALLEASGARLWIGLPETMTPAGDPAGVTAVSVDVLIATGRSKTARQVPLAPDLPAYLIFTSGSTGDPKPLFIPHRAVGALVATTRDRLPGRSTTPVNLACSGALIFDATVHEIYLSLLMGHTLFLVPEEIAGEPHLLLTYLETHPIQMIGLTPTLLTALIDAGLGLRPLTMEHLILGGEPLSPEQVGRLRERPHAAAIGITNAYGPTEACVDATHYVLPPGPPEEGPVPIGTPLDHARVVLRDRDGNPVPPGFTGELCIGGVGLALGYQDMPAKTAHAFRPDPYLSGSRLYHSGDRARLRRDGNLMFLGRGDDQVKVRGYRIECGEVEAALKKLPAVQEALVLPRASQSAGTVLVAYLRVDGARAGGLRQELARLLPTYMLPAHMVLLESFPRTATGKLDRNALPDPHGAAATSAAQHEPPHDGLERVLADLWREVLGHTRIGRHDNFFELGGHSLSATRLATAIHRRLDTRPSARDIFEHPTIAALASYLCEREPTLFHAIPRQPEAPNYPVSHAQKRVWVARQMAGDSAAYNMPESYWLDGPLDRDALVTAFGELYRRHEVLRTTFTFVQNEVRQVIGEEEEPPFTLVDLRGSRDPDGAALRLAQGETRTPFDLEKEPPIRLMLIRVADHRHLLMVNLHHIAVDGWSARIFWQSLGEIYQAVLQKDPMPPGPPLQYRDYTAWQHELLSGSTLDSHRQYWRRHLAGDLPVLQFPTDAPRPALRTYQGAEQRIHLSAETTRGLHKLARSHATTPFAVLAATVFTLLYRYTGQRDLICGMTVAGRRHADLDRLIGLFLNTLPLRCQPEGRQPFVELLADVRDTLNDALEHQDYPIDLLIEDLGVRTDPSRSPLFDVLLVMQNQQDQGPNFPGISAESLPQPKGEAKFDLSFYFREDKGRMGMALEYNVELFDQERMQRLAGHFQRLINTAVRDPKTPLCRLPMLGNAERHRLLGGFNQTSVPFDNGYTLSEAFSACAALFPDRPALVFAGRTHGYGELDAVTNSVARALSQQQAVAPGDFVAVFTRRSDWTIIAILGVLKAGAAYLALDPGQPPARSAYMVRNAGCKLVLSDGTPLPADLLETNMRTVDLRTITAEPEHLPMKAPSTAPAYVIYTSGSTGKPKGVIVSHRSVMNLVAGLENEIYGHHRQHLHEALIAPFIFDASVQQIFGALLLCHTLHVIDEETRRDPSTLCAYLGRHHIGIFDVTPGMFRALLEHDFGNRRTDLRHITIGAEEVSTDLVATWLNRPNSGGVRFTNTYGPTEATVECLTHTLAPDESLQGSSIPIGLPMANTRVYLLDRDGDLVPTGVPGEICIAGEGLAMGYLNQPATTADAFRPNPFEAGERIYHTGDLGIRRPDGVIQFLGRRDDQVKIHGYRIECGEIEQALLRHPDIRGALVLAKAWTGTDTELAAYLLGPELPTSELREHLARFLPAYMIPRYLVFMERFPLNASDKIDRTALPDPLIHGRPSSAGAIAPRDPLESRLSDLWRKVLHIPEKAALGIHDNFFERGGHSLTATRLASGIHQVLSVALPLRVLFQAPTIAEQAAVIRKQERSAFEPIKPAPTAAHYPLSHAQKRLWLLHQIEKNPIAYNIPAFTLLKGDLDVSALRQAFFKLFQRHETLRTHFDMVDEEPRQFVHPSLPLPFSQLDLSDLHDPELVADGYARKEATTPFDLRQGPLMRIVLLTLGLRRHLLLVTMHHIIADGWSLGVWLKELVTYYEAARAGRFPRLRSLKIQYRDYAIWQNHRLAGGFFERQRAYWHKRLAPPMEPLEMPTAKPRPREPGFNGSKVHFQLDPPLLEGLHELAGRHGASLYMALVALVKVLLYRYTGQSEIRIGSPIAGRNHADLEHQIGFFANTLVLRDFLNGDDTFEQVLGSVRETTTEAYDHQDYPFDLLVEELATERDLSRSPLFDVLLVLQNNELEAEDPPGLTLKPFDVDATVAKFDLLFDFREGPTGLDITLEYNSDLFTRPGMFRLVSHLLELTKSLLSHPRRPIARLGMLTQLDRIQLMSTFCPDQQTFSQTESVIELFEGAASRMFRHTALVHGDTKWTYHQLNQAVNQWAHQLREVHRVKPGDVVGVLPNRDPWAVVAMLAVLKSGAIYLPIDPENPTTRRAAIIVDAGCTLLLIGSGQDLPELAMAPPAFAIERLPEASKINPQVVSVQEDPAYIVYTSGSTGSPKGVVGTHRCLYNLMQWQRTSHRTMREARTLQYAALGFDVAVQEMLFTLITGGELHLIDDEMRYDIDRLTHYIAQHEIESLTMPYSVLNLLLHETAELDKLASLRHVITSGEQPYLTKGIRRFLASQPEAQLHNQYGPSETHVVTSFTVNHESEIEGRIPLGRPVSNTRVYVMDRYGQVLPIGCYGELWIGGANVGLGYVNQPELTDRRFVARDDLPDTMLYRSGDIGRWNEDGHLEFVGREDEQVKLRGFRVESNEVRRAMKAHASIQAAAIAIWHNDHQEPVLAGYYVAEPAVSPEALRSFVARLLPSYMVPSHMIPLEKIPLTRNGKLDNAALPRPAALDRDLARPFQMPRDRLERELATVWAGILGRERISVDDHYFELGGTSLDGMRLVAAVQRNLGREMRLRDLFQAPTVRQLAERLRDHDTVTYSEIEPAPKSEYYPASHGQTRLWLLQRMDPESVSYSIPAFFRAVGPLDTEAFRKSIEALVARHEALRTTLHRVDHQIFQKVHNSMADVMRHIDLGGLEAAEAQREGAELARREVLSPFDLERGPLLRAVLVHLNPENHLILLNMHHVVVDGWSMRILIRELQVLYQAFREGRANPLSPLTIQYKDHTIWLERMLHGGDLIRQREFWLRKLSPPPPPLNLPLRSKRPSVARAEGALSEFRFDAELSEALHELARRERVSLFMLLQALVKVLLHRYSGQADIVTGSPIAGRLHPDLDQQVGFYVNLLVLRDTLDPDTSFRDLLRQVHDTTAEAFEYQIYPFDQLLDDLPGNRDPSRSPLFDVLVVLQDDINDAPELEGLNLSPYPHLTLVSRFDLTFNFAQDREGLRYDLEYKTSLFHAGMIDRFSAHLQTLARSVTRDPARRLATLELLPQQELQQLRGLQAQATDNQLFPHLARGFERTVSRDPEAPAIYCYGRMMRYGELNGYANGLAMELLKYDLSSREPVIAVLTELGELSTIAMLAVLKIGGVYLPLSQAIPSERAEMMLRDAGASLLITQTELLNMLFDQDPPCAVHLQDRLPKPVGPSPNRQIDPDQAAYLIFTSGSTGHPKGVVCTHRGLINTAVDQGRAFAVTPRDRLLKLADVSFDASLYESFIALLHGASLVYVDYDTFRDHAGFRTFLEEQRVSWAVLPPAYLRLLEKAPLPSLRILISAGEAAHPDDARHYAGELGFVNAYGPTEASVCVSNHFAEQGRAYEEGVPLGRPIANTELWVLDAAWQPVPLGVEGEIAIAGVGLARSYLSASQTAARFVPHPLEEGRRIYLTGDRGRWSEAGELMYLGRTDHQVSLRGFRIECDEVRHALLRHSRVRQAHVMMRRVRGEEALVAYIAGDDLPKPQALRDFLGHHLFSYMVPSFFVNLETLPLTPNGKIDIRALPEPSRGGIAPERDEPPRDDLEKTLLGIWCDLLDLDEISIHDNFFELGGHSLTAVRLKACLVSEWNLDLSARAVFEHPTIAELAAHIDRLQIANYRAIPRRGEDLGEIPTSYAQRRLWLLHQIGDSDRAYHLSAAFWIDGPLDPDALSTALEALVTRHPSLRTTFVEHEGEPVQRILPTPGGFTLYRTELKEKKPTERQAAAIGLAQTHDAAPFNLAEGPPFRAMLIQVAPDHWLLSLTLHHLVADGWSVAILVQELTHLYGTQVRGATSDLPAPERDYADFALWQRDRMQDPEMAAHRDYWHKRLHPLPPVVTLPGDFTRTAVRGYRAVLHEHQIGPELIDPLRNLAARFDTSPFTLWLSLFAVVLYRHTGQRDLSLGTITAGRDRAELAPIVGMFVNTLVLRIGLDPDASFRDFFQQVRQRLRSDMDHADYPFDLLVEELAPPRDLAHNPLFDVLFVYQNNEAPPMDLAGVSLRPAETADFHAKFDLSVQLADTEDGGLVIQLMYREDLYRPDRIARLAAQMEQAARSMLADDEVAVGHLEVLPPQERDLVTRRFAQAPSKPYPLHRTAAELFLESAAKHNRGTAVVAGEERLGYADLARAVNQLGFRLRAAGAGPERVVAVAVPRSRIEWILSLLAVLETGAVYVYLDPEAPLHYRRHIAQSAQCRLLIHWGTMAVDGLELPRGCRTLDLAHPEPEAWETATEAPQTQAQVTNAAYLIYTSGSTGQPKGVTVTHRGFVNATLAKIDRYGVEPGDRLLQFAAPSFDVSLSEIFMALLSGATLVLMDREALAPHRFPDFVAERRISVLTLPPTYLQLLDNHPLPGLRVLASSGDHVHRGDAAFYSGKKHFFNAYGPTETSVCSHLYEVPVGFGASLPIPVGRPLVNTLTLILDDTGQPVPIGVPGEVFIGGTGLGRGYHAEPARTAERFVPYPRSLDGGGTSLQDRNLFAGQRLYRTGDRGRWTEEGMLEILGRDDDQVKIRGFRVSCQGVTATLRRHPGVADAVVTPWREAGGETRLLAFVVWHSPKEEDIEVQVRHYLAEQLPAYTLPSRFIELLSLPLGPTGKVDIGKLPVPSSPSPERGQKVATPPSDLVEAKLSRLWCDLLDCAPPMYESHFFELGGHSLKAALLVARLRRDLHVDLPLRSVFRHPTFGDQLAQVRAATGLKPRLTIPPIEAAPESKDYPLLPAQARLWFLDRLAEAGDATYLMVGGYRLQGELDSVALRRATFTLVARHEMLRAVFSEREGAPRLRFLSAEESPLESHLIWCPQTKKADLARVVAQKVTAPFDLGAAPPWRVVMVPTGKRKVHLYLALHHILTDGWGLHVLLADWAALYRAFAANREDPLPAPEVSFRDVTVWQETQDWQGQRAYWTRQLAAMPDPPPMPHDYPLQPNQPPRAGLLTSHLEAEVTTHLTELAIRRGTTLANVVLAGYFCLVHQLTARQDLWIGIGHANRDRPELERLVGLLVNVLVIRLDLDPEWRFETLLDRVTTEVQSGMANGAYPFERVVEDVCGARGGERQPLVNLMYSFQNFRDLHLGGVPGTPGEGEPTATKKGALRIDPLEEVEQPTAKFELTLYAARTEDGGLRCQWEYDARLYAEETISDMAAQLVDVLRAVAGTTQEA
ncbi:Non-ribosomal peptide synthase/polyketide synthase [Sulfidibacter corallicola]